MTNEEKLRIKEIIEVAVPLFALALVLLAGLLEHRTLAFYFLYGFVAVLVLDVIFIFVSHFAMKK